MKDTLNVCLKKVYPKHIVSTSTSMTSMFVLLMFTASVTGHDINGLINRYIYIWPLFIEAGSEQCHLHCYECPSFNATQQQQLSEGTVMVQ